MPPVAAEKMWIVARGVSRAGGRMPADVHDVPEPCGGERRHEIDDEKKDKHVS
jgi:hypothetical protein